MPISYRLLKKISEEGERMSDNRLFKEKSIEATRSVFMEFLNKNEAWFGALIYGIKAGWIDNGCNITEILLREGRPVAVAVLKAYIPCYCKDGENEFKPTKNQIMGVVDRFVGNVDGEEERGRKKFYGESIDFSFQVFGLGIFRVNFSHSNEGVTLSIRCLPYDVPELEAVGYPAVYRKYLETIIEKVNLKSPPVMQESFYLQLGEGESPALINEPTMGTLKVAVPRSGGGLILHIGPTGSGKTTAMAAEVNHVAMNTTGLILTYEDPPEYAFIATDAPVSSFELGRDIKESEDFTMAEMVQRHSLRKNPAVIMFGEMRTIEQMRMVVDMANRGHWVFTSMHGNSVSESIGTLASIFKDEPYVLANSLKAAVAHRLATNMKGEIVPLFEIFIPDKVRLEALAKGDITEIKRVFKEKLGDQSVSFENSIENLISTGKISLSEADQIRKTALGREGQK